MGIEQEVAPQNTKSRMFFHLNLQIIAYLLHPKYFDGVAANSHRQHKLEKNSYLCDTKTILNF